jgi:hypothetical protein
LGPSGSGFQAGGPAYLQRFAQEQVISINTAAAGGNASLVAMGDDRGRASDYLPLVRAVAIDSRSALTFGLLSSWLGRT